MMYHGILQKCLYRTGNQVLCFNFSERYKEDVAIVLWMPMSMHSDMKIPAAGSCQCSYLNDKDDVSENEDRTCHKYDYICNRTLLVEHVEYDEKKMRKAEFIKDY